MMGTRIALVSDDQALALAIGAHLNKSLGTSTFCSGFAAVRDHLGADSEGVVILAVASPPDAEEALSLSREIILQRWPITLLIAASGACSEEFQSLKGHNARLLRWPRDAALLTKLVDEGQHGGRPFVDQETEPAEDAIRRILACATPSLVPLAKQLALAAAHDVAVFITGETGTGKTFLARLIHDFSARKDHRFLVVPCGALVSSLLESELFGHVKGAFTGADEDRVGKFAAASGGTLLLDEIDSLGIDQQANLLRVLETGEFEPVGSNTTEICTARIIAASNGNVEKALLNGKIRPDLYYRLNVTSLHLPALRERVQDIPPLARMLTARFNTRFRKGLLDIDAEALLALQAFPWPGNLRQLENVMMHAVLVSSGTRLTIDHLPQPVQEWFYSNASTQAEPVLIRGGDGDERALVEQALSRCGYSRSRAADALGISRVTLYKRMKKFGLNRLHARGHGPSVPMSLPQSG